MRPTPIDLKNNRNASRELRIFTPSYGGPRMRPSMMVLLLILLTVSPSFSQILWNPDGIALRQAEHIAWKEAAAQNAQDEICFIWSDCRDGVQRIYAQKLSPASQPLWEETGVLVGGNFAEWGHHTIAALSDGEFIIVWFDVEFWSGAGYLRAQKIDADGNRLWGDNGISVTSQSFYPSAPRAIGDGQGGCYILWDNYSANTLHVSRFLADGTLAAGWPTDGSLITDIYHNPPFDVCSDNNDGIIVVWQGVIIMGNANIYAQRVNSAGTMLWTPGGEPVCIAANEQDNPQMVEDGAGGAFIVWEDLRNGIVSFKDLYIQRIDANGQGLFLHDIPVSAADRDQASPLIVSDGAGGVVVGWVDERASMVGFTDIYAQRVGPAGNLLWNANGVPVCTADDHQIELSIAPNLPNGYYFAWQDCRIGDPIHYDIYAQYVDDNGVCLWAENGIVISNLPFEQMNPKVFTMNDGDAAYLWFHQSDSSGIYLQMTDVSGSPQFPAGGVALNQGIDGSVEGRINILNLTDNTFMAVWMDNRTIFSGYRIYYQISDYDGNALMTANGCPATPVEGEFNQEDIRAARTSDGNIALIWRDCDESTQYIPQICCQLIDAQGNLLWNERGVFATAPTLYDQMYPFAGPDNAGGIYAAWSGYDENYIFKVFVQHFDAAGNLLWGSSGIELTNINDVDEVVQGIVPDGEGHAIVMWRGGNFLTDFDLFAARILSSGDTAWVRDICSALFMQSITSVIPSISRGAVIAWEDHRSGDYDVYIQKLDNSGAILWGENGLQLTNITGDQEAPQIIEDAEGYIFAVWNDTRSGTDFDIYCQRISPAGEILFPVNGLPVAVISMSDQEETSLIPDGAGGAYICWEDGRIMFGDRDIYALHLTAAGEIAHPIWAQNGNAVSDFANYQMTPKMIPDTEGGAVVIWRDWRASAYEGGMVNLYAQRINDFTTGVGDKEPTAEVPSAFRLYTPYPNPFNSSITINFTLPAASEVKLAIYDIQGREAAVLAARISQLGTNTIVWDAKGLGSGVYFVRLSVDSGQSSVKKVVLMK